MANGQVIQCSTTGCLCIALVDDNGLSFSALLTEVMYVPGLSHQLFSITKFASHGHHAIIEHNATILYFTGPPDHPMTIMALKDITNNYFKCIAH